MVVNNASKDSNFKATSVSRIFVINMKETQMYAKLAALDTS